MLNRSVSAAWVSARKLMSGPALGVLLLVALDSVPAFALSTGDLRGDSKGEVEDVVFVQFGSIRGKVLRSTKDDVVVELIGHPGSEVTVRRELVPPVSLYRIERSGIDETDPNAWLKLADFASEYDLHLQRMSALKRAYDLAPDRRKEIGARIEECREACTKDRLSLARQYLQTGELDRARKTLREGLRTFRDCAAAGQLEELLRVVDELIADERRASRKAAGKPKTLDAALRTAQALVRKGEEALKLGRMSMDSKVRATNAFLEAMTYFVLASKRVGGMDAVEARPVQESDSDLLRLRLVVRDDLLQTHLELGHIYLARGDRRKAYEHAGLAAVLDPTDPAVVSLRGAIATTTVGR